MSTSLAPISPISISAGIVYSRTFNLGFCGLERLHAFDGRKFARAYRILQDVLGAKLRSVTLRPANPVDRAELLTFHSEKYLGKLRDPAYLSSALEIAVLKRVPLWITDRMVLRPMRWATAGAILAAREALNRGLMMNLGGGFHHASRERGGGFCIYSDIALAVGAVRRDGLLRPDDRILYIDLDAHQGNGVCHAFFDDPKVMIFDLFNCDIYPYGDLAARRRIDCAVPIGSGCSDADYLHALLRQLPPFVDAINRSGEVRLAIYNAGTDILAGDALGSMNVSADGILKRDQFVLDQLMERRIPTVMLTSGGYSRESAEVIARTACWAYQKYAADACSRT